MTAERGVFSARLVQPAKIASQAASLPKNVSARTRCEISHGGLRIKGQASTLIGVEGCWEHLGIGRPYSYVTFSDLP